MDIDFYLPCQPEWLCVPFMTVFGLLLLAGLIKFIRIAYREYKKIERAKAVKSSAVSIIASAKAAEMAAQLTSKIVRPAPLIMPDICFLKQDCRCVFLVQSIALRMSFDIHIVDGTSLNAAVLE